jgi:hypothetical protein
MAWISAFRFDLHLTSRHRFSYPVDELPGSKLRQQVSKATYPYIARLSGMTYRKILNGCFGATFVVVTARIWPVGSIDARPADARRASHQQSPLAHANSDRNCSEQRVFPSRPRSVPDCCPEVPISTD